MDALSAPRRAAAAIAGAPASFALAAACVAWLGWVEAHGSSTDPEILVRFGALERGRVWDGEPWRLLSAAFLHIGWVHLAWNVGFGVLACRLVERAVGSVRLVVVYLASALGASALSLLGQDAIAAGASGPLFGIVGAILALHRRGLPSWRAFLRSGATLWMLGSIASMAILLPVLGVHADQLAHVGGFATGAAAGWLVSPRGRRRALPWVAFGAALAALVVAATWPRDRASRFEGEHLERALEAALRSGDTLEAREVLARAGARRWRSDRLAFDRAFLLIQEGDLEGAIAAARPLVDSTDRAVAREAAAKVVELARSLAYRYATGEGAAQSDVRAAVYWQEACALGDRESCRNLRRTGAR